MTASDTSTQAPRSGTRGRSVASVVDALREQILTGQLLPGEQIRQEEMARILGVSRVPLREALRVLTAEGMLTHRPHQGYRITKISRQDLEQIHALLEFLETELIRTVRWPADDEIRRLRELNRRILAAHDDISAINRLNRELHAGIFRLSPLEIYRTEAERFWTLSEPYRLLHVATTDPAVAVAQHEQLIDALAAQDRALCLRVLAQHRRETQSAAFSALDGMAPRHAVPG